MWKIMRAVICNVKRNVKNWQVFLAFFLLFLSTRNVGLIYCYADELSEDSENTAEDAEQEQQKIKETILSEFEYGEIDDSLRSLFPEKRIAFQEVISEILTGDLKSSVKLLTEFAGEQMFYLLQTGKKNLVHILLIAMIAAFMNQFAGTLQNRQVASVGFYMIGGTDGCGIRCGYSVGGIRDT